MNHIESGFHRENQIEVANAIGVLISNAKQGGSIESDFKKMCQAILADWARE